MIIKRVSCRRIKALLRGYGLLGSSEGGGLLGKPFWPEKGERALIRSLKSSDEKFERESRLEGKFAALGIGPLDTREGHPNLFYLALRKKFSGLAGPECREMPIGNLAPKILGHRPR